MNRKLVTICLFGILVFGISACDDKIATGSEQGTQTSTKIESNGQTETTNKKIGLEIITAQRISERKDYVGYQDLDIDEYVTLNDYRNMKVTVYKPEIKDEDVEQYINSEMLKGNVTDRAVKNGDVVNIDYEIGINGVALEDSMVSGYDLEIGSGSSIEGFEEGLIGVMPEETIDLHLTLEGQPVVFVVTVNSIAESMEYANVSDADLAGFGLSYENKEALWEAAKAEVEKNAEETFEDSKISAILDQVLSESTIKSVPEYLVEELIQEIAIHMETMSQRYYGANFEQYLQEVENKSFDDLVAELRPECETRVKQYLILEALARAEQIEITDELIRAYAGLEIGSFDRDMVDTYVDMVGYTMYRMYVLQEELEEHLNKIITVEITSEE